MVAPRSLVRSPSPSVIDGRPRSFVRSSPVSVGLMVALHAQLTAPRLPSTSPEGRPPSVATRPHPRRLDRASSRSSGRTPESSTSAAAPAACRPCWPNRGHRVQVVDPSPDALRRAGPSPTSEASPIASPPVRATSSPTRATRRPSGRGISGCASHGVPWRWLTILPPPAHPGLAVRRPGVAPQSAQAQRHAAVVASGRWLNIRRGS